MRGSTISAPLGLFDSGIGGLTVLRRLRETLPDHDIVYLADQARVPYGGRPFDELFSFLETNLAYLRSRGAQMIVMACNTSCAVAADYGWPDMDVPILDLIDNAAEMVGRTGLRRIGVIATAATVRSGAYGRAIRSRMEGVQIQEVAAPELVPLVESGCVSGAEALAVVKRACAPFSRLDAVVYGCTHYPVLDECFEAVLGPRILRLDPAFAQAQAAAELVADRNIAEGEGRVSYATTGDVVRFRDAVRLLVGERVPDVNDAAHIISPVA